MATFIRHSDLWPAKMSQGVTLWFTWARWFSGDYKAAGKPNMAILVCRRKITLWSILSVLKAWVGLFLVKIDMLNCWLYFSNAKKCIDTIYILWIEVEETINIRTPAIIGRSYTEAEPRRYPVMPRKGRQSPPYPMTEKWSSSVNHRLR